MKNFFSLFHFRGIDALVTERARSSNIRTCQFNIKTWNAKEMYMKRLNICTPFKMMILIDLQSLIEELIYFLKNIDLRKLIYYPVLVTPQIFDLFQSN